MAQTTRRAVRSTGGAAGIALLAVVLTATSSVLHAQGPGQDGRWVPPQPQTPPQYGTEWPLAPMHAIHLPTGKILVMRNASDGAPRLYDLGTGSPDLEITYMVGGGAFTDDIGCSGHVLLTGGGALVCGGSGGSCTNAHNHGWIYQNGWYPATGPVAVSPPPPPGGMHLIRWYPTLTSLPDSSVLVGAGDDSLPGPVVCEGAGNLEVYAPSARAFQLLNASSLYYDSLIDPNGPDYLVTYPFLHVLHTGKVFFSGGRAGNATWQFDVPTQSWTFVGNSLWGHPFGSAVMWAPGKVLMCGGSSGAGFLVQVTEMIDMTAPTPTWQSQPDWDMAKLRIAFNLVLLPNERILAVGGASSTDLHSGPLHDAEWFDPYNPVLGWNLLASWDNEPQYPLFQSFDRFYHSVALLQLDGRVLTAGGDGELTAHIFEPPYLFNMDGSPATRPVIVSSPAMAGYGPTSSFTVRLGPAVPAASIAKVTLVRPGAVTHGFDQNQRLVRLPHTVLDSSTLRVNAPANVNEAPPGHYMLFVVSNAGSGVPSEGKYIQLVP